LICCTRLSMSFLSPLPCRSEQMHTSAIIIMHRQYAMYRYIV
jgi:hypothetical protein